MADVIHLLPPPRHHPHGDPCPVLPLGEPLAEIVRQHPGKFLIVMDAYLPGRGVLVASGPCMGAPDLVQACEALQKRGIQPRVLGPDTA